MKVKLDIDLNEAVIKALESALDPVELQANINVHINNLVSELIKRETTTYSKFGSALDNHIKSMFPEKFDKQTQSRFRDGILKVVEGTIAMHQDASLEEQLKTKIESMLVDQPASVTLSEIVEKAISYWSDSSHIRNGSRAPTVIAEESDSSPGYWQIHIDSQQHIRKWECSIHLSVSPDGHVYALKADGQDVKKSFFVGPMYDLNRYLFWLYCGATKIVIDQTDFSDVYYNS